VLIYTQVYTQALSVEVWCDGDLRAARQVEYATAVFWGQM